VSSYALEFELLFVIISCLKCFDVVQAQNLNKIARYQTWFYQQVRDKYEIISLEYMRKADVVLSLVYGGIIKVGNILSFLLKKIKHKKDTKRKSIIKVYGGHSKPSGMIQTQNYTTEK
jgi:hypothetical protein